MSAIIPDNIKIYHILHISKLPIILDNKYLISDAEVRKHPPEGVTIGMSEIKRRRLEELTLPSYPDLYVGECVPFYFCPRSIMLYMLHMGNHPDIEYRDGQKPIIHLVADLINTVKWAEQNGLRWMFTDSNAGARYFEGYSNLRDLDKINWQAVQATMWNDPQIKEKKQAEFLVERCFPWELVEEIGVYSFPQLQRVQDILGHKQKVPPVKIQGSWYY